MSTTTKSPKKLAVAAYLIARGTLTEHNSRYSPKKFTQPQLMVRHALKTLFNTDYRSIVQILDDCPNLYRVFELNNVPHFTTLHKASQRLLKSPSTQTLIEGILKSRYGQTQNRQTCSPLCHRPTVRTYQSIQCVARDAIAHT